MNPVEARFLEGFVRLRRIEAALLGRRLLLEQAGAHRVGPGDELSLGHLRARHVNSARAVKSALSSASAPLTESHGPGSNQLVDGRSSAVPGRARLYMARGPGAALYQFVEKRTSHYPFWGT